LRTLVASVYVERVDRSMRTDARAKQDARAGTACPASMRRRRVGAFARVLIVGAASGASG
jgi:hypothetical protein